MSGGGKTLEETTRIALEEHRHRTIQNLMTILEGNAPDALKETARKELVRLGILEGTQ
jgi:hypothetical protein